MGIRKTFKREIAVVLLVCLIALAAYAMVPLEPAIISARSGVVSALAFPIISFAAVAFGMDWAAKQTSFGGPPLGDVFAPDSFGGGDGFGNP